MPSKTKRVKKSTKKTKARPKIEAWEWPAGPATPAFFQMKIGKNHYRIGFDDWYPVSKAEYNETFKWLSVFKYSKLSPAKARKVNAARLKGVRPW